MTREEAMRNLSEMPFGPSCGTERWLIDALFALGVLGDKDDGEDECVEKSPWDRLFDQLKSSPACHYLPEIKIAIECAGLKLVEA